MRRRTIEVWSNDEVHTSLSSLTPNKIVSILYTHTHHQYQYNRMVISRANEKHYGVVCVPGFFVVDLAESLYSRYRLSYILCSLCLLYVFLSLSLSHILSLHFSSISLHPPVRLVFEMFLANLYQHTHRDRESHTFLLFSHKKIKRNVSIILAIVWTNSRKWCNCYFDYTTTTTSEHG